MQSIDDVKRRIEQGWQFLAIGSELRFMTMEAQKICAGLNLKKSSDLAGIDTRYPIGQRQAISTHNIACCRSGSDPAAGTPVGVSARERVHVQRRRVLAQPVRKLAQQFARKGMLVTTFDSGIPFAAT